MRWPRVERVRVRVSAAALDGLMSRFVGEFKIASPNGQIQDRYVLSGVGAPALRWRCCSPGSSPSGSIRWATRRQDSTPFTTSPATSVKR